MYYIAIIRREKGQVMAAKAMVSVRLGNWDIDALKRNAERLGLSQADTIGLALALLDELHVAQAVEPVTAARGDRAALERLVTAGVRDSQADIGLGAAIRARG